MEVSLDVQKNDWHVDEMTLSFEDASFQITEEDSSILDRREVPNDVLARLEPQEPANLVAHAPAAPHETALRVNPDDLEMEVRSDLHKIGADLGETIEIAMSPSGELVVNAAGVSPQMRQQLAALLADKASVRLELQEPGTRGSPGRPTDLTVLPQTTTPQDDERLRNFFGGSQEEENYARSVLRVSANILAHLYALRDLAGRWPPEQAARLSPAAETQLATMVRDHARDLQAGMSQLRTHLDLLLKGFGYPDIAENTAGANTNWQNASASGLDAGRLTDRILRSLPLRPTCPCVWTRRSRHFTKARRNWSEP